MQKISKNKGITLVSLIVTIIILMILVGVVIATVTGNNGILSKSKLAMETYQNSASDENNTLSKYENEIDKSTIDVASSRDEVTISKDEYNRLINANSYSLDEKEIGTGIDGKKIYQKSITINVTNNTDYTFNAKELLSSDINTITNIYGYSITDNGYTYAQFPCYYTSIARLSAYTEAKTKVVHIISGTQYATATHNLTFEYTKLSE